MVIFLKQIWCKRQRICQWQCNDERDTAKAREGQMKEKKKKKNWLIQHNECEQSANINLYFMQVSSGVNNYVIWSCTGDCWQSTYSRNWKLADEIISMATRKCLPLFDFFSLTIFYSKLNWRLLLSAVRVFTSLK